MADANAEARRRRCANQAIIEAGMKRGERAENLGIANEGTRSVSVCCESKRVKVKVKVKAVQRMTKRTGWRGLVGYVVWYWYYVYLTGLRWWY